MRIRRAFLHDQWPAAAGRDHVAEQGTLKETSNNRTIDASPARMLAELFVRTNARKSNPPCNRGAFFAVSVRRCNLIWPAFSFKLDGSQVKIGRPRWHGRRTFVAYDNCSSRSLINISPNLQPPMPSRWTLAPSRAGATFQLCGIKTFLFAAISCHCKVGMRRGRQFRNATFGFSSCCIRVRVRWVSSGSLLT